MCQGKTAKGKQCKRKGEPFCYQHGPKTADPVPPISLVDCSAKGKSKILRRLHKGPRKSDGPGYIYVYTLPNDGSKYYKVGRTRRDVDVRLKEWKGAQLKAAWPVKTQMMAETLIHGYLDHIRCYRYAQDDGTFSTVWKDTGEPVTKADASGKRKGIAKQVEWFRGKWKHIEAVCEAICALY